MAAPKIAVFLTVYKRSKYIAQAIESVLSQSMHDFELIILDDGGDEQVASIISNYTDSRIVHKINRPRIGVAASIFSAIKSCPFEYFCILNDDDCFAKDFLSKLIMPLEMDRQIAISFCDHYIIDAESRVSMSKTDQNTELYGRSALESGRQGDLPSLVIDYNAVPMAMGSVVRRSAVPLQMLDDRSGKHYDLWLSLIIAHGSNVAFYTPERLSYYRVHPEAETERKHHAQADDLFKVYRLALSYGLHPGYEKVFKKRRNRLLMQMVRARLAELWRRFADRRAVPGE